MARKKAEAGDADKQGALVFQQGQPPDLFRKAVPAIHIAPKSGSISLQQRKMFSRFLSRQRVTVQTWYGFPGALFAWDRIGTIPKRLRFIA